MKNKFFITIAILVAVIAITSVVSWFLGDGEQQLTGKTTFQNSETVSLVLILIVAAVVIAALLIKMKRLRKNKNS